MSDLQIGIWGLVAVITLIAARMPIGIALISVSYFGIWAIGGHGAAWGMLSVMPHTLIASWTLSAVPMFLLMGFICYHGKLTNGLFDAARLWFMRLPGGLAIASVFGCSGFAAITGSSVACAAAMGKIAVPEMVRHKYDIKLATGTLAAAGTIGALIPPSIPLIIYGVIAQVSITKLFLGGIGVGLATAFSYVLVILVRTWLNPSLAPRTQETVTFREKLLAGVDADDALLEQRYEEARTKVRETEKRLGELHEAGRAMDTDALKAHVRRHARAEAFGAPNGEVEYFFWSNQYPVRPRAVDLVANDLPMAWLRVAGLVELH